LFEPIICQICGQNFTDKVLKLKTFLFIDAKAQNKLECSVSCKWI